MTIEHVVVAETPPPEPPVTLAVSGETVVAVAEIEAARDVAIAEQHTEQTQIMADASETATDEDLAWLRGELDGLRQHCETNAGELSNLRAALLTTQEQLQAALEQITVLTVATAPPPSEPPLTPEPDLPPPDADPADPESTPPPPEPPSAEPKRRQRKWL